jgi:hypothetical protein
MKKYGSLLLFVGILLSLLPMYEILSWIYLYTQNPELSHLEKVAKFEAEYALFNFSRVVDGLLLILLGLLGTGLIFVNVIFTFYSNGRFIRILKIIVLALAAIFTTCAIWSMM